MRVFGKTDIGRLRGNNQDAFICGRLNEEFIYAVVCDGMGGANGGNVASAIAIRTIADRLAESVRPGMSMSSLQNVLESAIAAANVQIYDQSAADFDLRGMGTTLVMAVMIKDEVLIAHVGDSRAYVIIDEAIEQLTRDHSVVQAMVEKGQITAEQARTHPRRNFITRALGVDVTVACDFTQLTLPREATLLLCTDGLTNMVEKEEIARIIGRYKTEELPDRLVSAANLGGGSDNITVAVITE